MSKERKHQEEKKVKYGPGGATRSKIKERYDLIPAIGSYAEALRYGIGVEKHGEGNWKHGDKQFVKSCFNHLQLHYNDLLNFINNESKETVIDNCGAIKWAASAIAWYATYRPEIYKQAMIELQDGLVENAEHTKSR